jgi:hypothetical protein
VVQPDIVSLLSSKDTNCSTDDDAGNDDHCEETSRDTHYRVGADLRAAGIISITDTTAINSGSRNLLQIASSPFRRAEGNIAVSNKRGHLRILSTILEWGLATKDRVAEIISAGISIVTDDSCVDTSSGWIAAVVGADIVVVTIEGDVEWKVSASILRITEVVGACIDVIAVNWSVFAGTSSGVAGINTAEVVVIAVDGSSLAQSICIVTLNNLAWNWSAGLWESSHWISAERAGDWRMITSSAGIACIRGAGVVVSAVPGYLLTSYCGSAAEDEAWVAIAAGPVDVLTSSGRDTGIVCAGIVVGATPGRVSTSISSLSSSASICSAEVAIITYVRTDTGSSTRAESKASTSTWIARNINASSNDEGIEDTRELREVCSEEGGLYSRNSRGNEVDLRLECLSYSNGKHQYSCILCIPHNGCEGGGSSVVPTISEYDHHLGNSSSSIVVELIVSHKDTTSNASGTSSLTCSIQSIEEGLLDYSQSNNQSCIIIEQYETHGNVVGTEGVGVGNAGSKVLLLSERGSIDRTTLIEHQHEVDHPVALLVGAVPGGVFIEDVGRSDSTHVAEVNLLAIHKFHSANNARGINPDVSDSSRGGIGLCVSRAISSGRDVDSRVGGIS